MTEFVYDHQVLRLTQDFYDNYPNPPYSELLTKGERPYNCLLIQSNYDYFICVPYRTEIRHNNAYKFSCSVRSSSHDSGLDYSKIIIVSNDNYIDAEPALVDDDEYVETVRNLERITREAKKYVDEYVEHCKGIRQLHRAAFDRKYRFSTLKYFHDELQI